MNPVIACENGDLDAIKQLVTPANLNELHVTKAEEKPYKETLLHLACRRGYKHIVKSLLSVETVDPNIKNSETETPLIIACKEDYSTIVECLLQHSLTNVNLTNQTGFSPLHYACMKGFFSIAVILLEQPGIKIKTYMPIDSPLYLASQNGHNEIVEHLLKFSLNVNDKNKQGNTPLNIACENGHFYVVNTLLHQPYIDINSNSSITSPLYLACKQNHVRIAQLLIDKGVDINQKNQWGFAPLSVACCEGKLEIVQFLLANPKIDIEINAEIASPLYIACINGHTEIVRLLIEKKAKLTVKNKHGDTPLHAACQEGFIEVVELLLDFPEIDREANANIASPFYLAAKNGHLKVVRLLMEKGVNTNDLQKNSAIFIEACKQGDIELIKLFYQKKLHIPLNIKHNSALLALSEKRIELFSLLINNFKQDKYKKNLLTAALRFSCIAGDWKIYHFTIQQGVDINQPLAQDKPPIILATLFFLKCHNLLMKSEKNLVAEKTKSKKELIQKTILIMELKKANTIKIIQNIITHQDFNPSEKFHNLLKDHPEEFKFITSSPLFSTIKFPHLASFSQQKSTPPPPLERKAILPQNNAN